jgi:signal transduction histidine kinase
VDASGKTHRQVAGVRTRDWDEHKWGMAAFLAEGSRPACVASSRRAVVVSDLHSLPADSRDLHWIHQAEGGRSALAVPIFRGDRVGGSLMVAFRSLHPPTQDDVASAEALANQAAVALENARLIESLRMADHLKDEFLSAAAHELKTPVTTIKGWTQILLKGTGRKVDERRVLEILHGQSDRIARLSEDLLAVARLRPDSPSLGRERFDLSELLAEVVEEVRARKGGHDLQVATPGPLLVGAHRRLIGEVLGRLLDNALRYSPGGKPIEVSARQEGGEAVISVRDHGVGIPPERQRHVFEPFYESVPTGKQGYVGVVSLGLHLSKQIVERHGGRIWFDSAPGEGSTFSFSLPLV